MAGGGVKDTDAWVSPGVTVTVVGVAGTGAGRGPAFAPTLAEASLIDDAGVVVGRPIVSAVWVNRPAVVCCALARRVSVDVRAEPSGVIRSAARVETRLTIG